MGGKSSSKAEESSAALAEGEDGQVPEQKKAVLPCEVAKHWIGVRIEDEDGAIVKDVTVHIKLTDGSEIDVDMKHAGSSKTAKYKTKKTLPAGDCEFTFPSLYDLDWWPEGGKAGAFTVARDGTVDADFCAVSLAGTLGLRDYKQAWDHADNKALRDNRVNPNALAKDDVFHVPDQKKKVEKKAVDQVWTFVVRNRPPPKIRLVLVDRDNKPLADRKWEIKSPVAKRGKTDASGLIEQDPLPTKHGEALFEVTWKDASKAAAKKAAAAAAKSPPPYPPPLVPEQFKDPNEALDLKAQIVKFTLKIGALAAFNDKPGTLERLHNLGFRCETASDDEATEKAVKRYQRFFLKDKKGSGKPDDIQADLRDRHDKA